MSTYQGHLSDGSSVQKHSAGGLYPYVIYAKDTPNGLRYGVMTPNGNESPAIYKHNDAVDLAWEFKANRVGLSGRVH